MSQPRGKSHKVRGKKLAIQKQRAAKDLEPKRGLKAGATQQTAEFMRMVHNHNETLVRDAARKRTEMRPTR
jgi:hypothetical protein